MPNSRVATYKQSYTTRYRTIRRVSLRCEAGAHRVEADPSKKRLPCCKATRLANLLKLKMKVEIEIEIEMQKAGVMQCGRTKETVQSSVSIGTVDHVVVVVVDGALQDKQQYR